MRGADIIEDDRLALVKSIKKNTLQNTTVLCIILLTSMSRLSQPPESKKH